MRDEELRRACVGVDAIDVADSVAALERDGLAKRVGDTYAASRAAVRGEQLRL